MKSIKGYEIKDKKDLSHWDCLLKEWISAIEKYSKIMEGLDASYFYNERANVGVLAGAAWRAGWVALEEFQSMKGYRNEKKVNGRCDLYFARENLDEELIEAKFKWICLGSSNVKERIECSMQAALHDVRKSKADSNLRSVGVGFFPAYRRNTRVNNPDLLIDKTIRDAREANHHAIAWCFPQEMRDHVSDLTGNLLPGIILLARNIDYR